RPDQVRPDGRAGRNGPGDHRRDARPARPRCGHAHRRPVPPALAASPPGRALRAPGHVRYVRARGGGARLQPRCRRSDGALLLPRRPTGPRRGRELGGTVLRFSGYLAALLVSAASAAGLDDITNRDATNGLKTALTNGAQSAVAKLGKEDGFMSDSRIKI